MKYSKILPMFWRQNKYLLIALAMVHITFTVFIVGEVYKSMGGADFVRGLDMAVLFEKIIPINVSDGEAKTVFPDDQFVYALESTELDVIFDTGKYTVRKASHGLSLLSRRSQPQEIFSINILNTDKDIAEFTQNLTSRLNQQGYSVVEVGEIKLPLDNTGTGYLVKDKNSTRLFGLFEYEGQLLQVSMVSLDREVAVSGDELDEFVESIQPRAEVASDRQAQAKVDQLNLQQQANLLAAKPSVARVYARACAQISGLGNGDYRVCDTQLASGFYVNYQGYLVTTNQLTIFDQQDLVVNAVMDFYGLDALANFALEYKPVLVTDDLRVLRNYNLETAVRELGANPNLRINLAQQMISNKDIQIAPPEYEFVIQKGTQVFDLDINGDLLNLDSQLVAEMVDKNSQGDNGYVLLKLVDPTDLPVLKLATSSGTEGNSLFTISYPTVETDLYNFSKRDAGNQDLRMLNLVEAIDQNQVLTDLDVIAGVIGAPVLDESGFAVGMLSNQTNQQKAIVVDNTKLFRLLEEHDVLNEIGVVGQKWEQAVHDFNKEKYRNALKGFRAVQENYTDIPVVDQLSILAEDRIASGYDKTNNLLGLRNTAFNNYTQSEVVTFIGSSTGVVLLAIGSFFSITWVAIVRFSNKHNQS